VEIVRHGRDHRLARLAEKRRIMGWPLPRAGRRKATSGGINFALSLCVAAFICWVRPGLSFTSVAPAKAPQHHAAAATVASRARSMGAQQQQAYAAASHRGYDRSGSLVSTALACGVLLAAVSRIANSGSSTSVNAKKRNPSRLLRRSAVDGVEAPLSLFSPAKVNLFLRIMGRRPDGYHDLASLFHTVSFGDRVDMELLPPEAKKDELACNLANVPVDDSNLVIRALKLLRKKTGIDRFFSVRLEKSIPAQAGMGGGSSNAATVFFGANQLLGSPASPADLMQWSRDPVVGSDATFFLSEGTAYCTGRGEIVTPVEPLPLRTGTSLFLVKPRYGLSTPKVFKALDMSRLSTTDPADLLSVFNERGTSHSQWVNDLEAPAFEVEPRLGQLKKFLQEEGDFGFDSVLMSGSGTTIYCVGSPRRGVDEFKEAVRQRFDVEGIWQCSLVRREGLDSWYAKPPVV